MDKTYTFSTFSLKPESDTLLQLHPIPLQQVTVITDNVSEDFCIIGKHETLGETIFNSLLEAGTNRKLKVRLVQDTPTKSRPNTDTADLATKGAAQVRTIYFRKLFGSGILHTKLWLVDRKSAYIGSANSDWRSLTQVKEIGIYIKDCPCLVEDIGKIFDAYWMLGEPNAKVPGVSLPHLTTTINENNPLFVKIDNSVAGVYVTSSPPSLCPDGRTTDFQGIKNVISRATKFIYISVMDYHPLIDVYSKKPKYWGHLDDHLKSAAIDSNVEIRMLISSWTSTRDYANYFLRSLADINGAFPDTKIYIAPPSALDPLLVQTLVGSEMMTPERNLLRTVFENCDLVGLAFEVHDSVKVAKEKDLNDDSPHAEFESSRIATPGFMEIFHYSFCYIGVLTGPYFKYRMYWDLFNAPFSDNADCLRDTTNKLKPVPFFGLAFLISSYFFPLSYALTDEFYFERSVLYRLWYLYPSFFNFRMRMYIGMQLSECVFTMAGLGAYPQVTEPKPGQGPTKEYTTLARIAADPELAKKEKYDFEAIHNIDAWNSDFKPTIRSSMKAWNMTIQYWLAVNVYKRFPIKAYRMPVTFAISSLWHGVYAGYYLCLCSVPTYLPAEDIFNKNLRNNTLPAGVDKVWAFIRYWYKMLHFSYWSMAFNLLYVDRCFRYWSSIYFIPNLLTIAMYAIGFTVFSNKKKDDRKSDEKFADRVDKSTKTE
ncbi:hypothetical protein LSTR_LSTR006301 [Laodelphax striatellus]|uniref:PLD phosphodiesterase domain-containing protein n=1 Tax=Laodelphax striatellus TaxID=195883 RepID=A0A482X677_LAOST|nr:hypothetical protein LSTR_LSTR006301 [Laodelphax striatellus]